jgi:hypothetical protein
LQCAIGFLLSQLTSINDSDPTDEREKAGSSFGPFAGQRMSSVAPTRLPNNPPVELASYYERNLAVIDGVCYQWTPDSAPRPCVKGIAQVGVGESDSYALDSGGALLHWRDDPAEAELLIEEVRCFAAGASGVLAIRRDDSLWHAPAPEMEFVQVGSDALDAAVGDGADYYVARDGGLYATGLAHRGQYGDGRLEPSEGYIKVATGVRLVRAHTGHALALTIKGKVIGTGGNRYGPLRRVGLGDKAVRWTAIFEGAVIIATGARHTLVIDREGGVWTWGLGMAGEGDLEPRKVMGDATAVAAGMNHSVAKARDGEIWQWRVGEAPRRVLFDA